MESAGGATISKTHQTTARRNSITRKTTTAWKGEHMPPGLPRGGQPYSPTLLLTPDTFPATPGAVGAVCAKLLHLCHRLIHLLSTTTRLNSFFGSAIQVMLARKSYSLMYWI